MPRVTVSHSLFDIQISMTTTDRPSVLEIVLAWIQVGPRLIQAVIKALQEHWLETDLGPSGAVGTLFEQAEFACPDCGSRQANRKDMKVRRPVVPVLGEIPVPQRRVTCQDCGSVYRPYEEILGLPANKKYTKEALMEGIRNALVTSYERASTLMSTPSSANTIHRAVQETTPDVPCDDGEYALVVMDATDVPRWKESGQITLTLAHEVSQGPEVHGRSTLDREVVAVAVGSEEDIKDLLEAPKIEGLMHDGKLRVDELCEVEGRCLWHVPYTAKHLLYQDGISGEDNKELVNELSNILFDDDLSPSQRERTLRDWIEEHESTAPQTCRHVALAREGIRNVEENPSLFDVVTTSPMEREMVELNKRFENGGGWTQSGAEALLWHLQLWLINPVNWLDQVWSDDGSGMTEFLQNSLI